ncbi:SRPBCC family protein [Streptomyces sp. NPDC047315]|uniref:SRPBCC family protein n=1 Tax=Streptomyces sp. NPDC047315 TaxID=3155142 RepID=UPI0033F45183
MTRTDRVSKVIAAPPAVVYGSLLDPAALEAWLPPQDMSGRIEQWDPRPGGGFRMVLTYLDPTDSPGKTSDATDVVEVGFVDLVPAERVVQRAVFEAEDPAYAGVMTLTWELVAVDAGDGAGAGTEVTVTATDVPPGISRADHEAGLNSSLANLAAHVTGQAFKPSSSAPGEQ